MIEELHDKSVPSVHLPACFWIVEQNLRIWRTPLTHTHKQKQSVSTRGDRTQDCLLWGDSSTHLAPVLPSLLGKLAEQKNRFCRSLDVMSSNTCWLAFVGIIGNSGQCANCLQLCCSSVCCFNWKQPDIPCHFLMVKTELNRFFSFLLYLSFVVHYIFHMFNTYFVKTATLEVILSQFSARRPVPLQDDSDDDSSLDFCS